MNTKKLVISYVDKTGNIKLKHYDWDTPMKYVNCEDNDPQRHPTLKSWNGHHVKQIEVNYPDRYAVYEFLDQLPEKEKTEIFEYNTPKIYFIDIETEIVDGFPEAETALTRVLSISIVYEDKIILLGLKDLSTEAVERIRVKTNEYFKKFNTDYKIRYVKYADEFDMLHTFFHDMIKKMPCMSGWNFINYDWVYLINRARKLKKVINGVEREIDVNKSSIMNKLSKVWMTNYEMPMHRMIFDYMQLYEICDNSIKVKESSSLDYVANKLVGIEKIKYTGSLQKLYEEDYEKFMYYNTVDSALVQKIHESRNFISIIYAISSLSRIKIVDVVSQVNNALASLAITEGVLRNRFREQENIVLFKSDKDESNGDDKIAGGWVKDPVVGLNQWVVCYDFASLYPTTQRQFYIAPETFVGIQNPNNKDFCDNGLPIDPIKHVICINGCVFEKRNSPTLRMLEDVYADRKFNKKIMMKKKDELKKIQDQIKELENSL